MAKTACRPRSVRPRCSRPRCRPASASRASCRRRPQAAAIRDPQTGDQGDAPRRLSQARLLRAGRDRDGRRTFRRRPAALRISRRRRRIEDFIRLAVVNRYSILLSGGTSARCLGQKRTNPTVGLLTESVVCKNPKIEMTGRCRNPRAATVRTVGIRDCARPLAAP